MAGTQTVASIDDYIAGFPAETRTALESVRATIRAAVPEATETISYAIPTYDLGGRHLVHFAGYQRHIGLYPVAGATEALGDELGPYLSGKATARFPLDRPLPIGLIRRVVEIRAAQLSGKNEG